MYEHHIKVEHYTGIGQIAVAWASLETLLMLAISSVMNIEEHIGMVTFWHDGYKDRRDRLTNLLNLQDRLNDEERKEYDCLLTRMDAAYRIRNTAVHSVWAIGNIPDAIKPHSMVARGGKKLKISGITMPEEDFTPKRFSDEVAKIQRLAQDFHQFAISHLGYQPFDPNELEQ